MSRSFVIGVGALLLLLPAAGPVGAQDQPQDRQTTEEGGGDLRPTVGIAPGPGGGLERAVDGSRYRLGPGDILMLGIYGPSPSVHQLPVTLEGKVIIPEIAEIQVDGLLLDDAKERIRNTIRGTYPGVDAGVSLVGLRKFQIHVLGQVRAPGTYLGSAVDRVSAAVAWAGGLFETSGKRNVQIFNADTLRTTADLFSFLSRGDRSGNPTLMDGDVILVPYVEDRFWVHGAVNQPGTVELLEGDTLGDALRLAGGFNYEASMDTLEVARYSEGSTQPRRFYVVSGDGILPASGQELPPLELTGDTFSPSLVWMPKKRSPVYADFKLQPNDHIFVRVIPRIQRERLVEISGEVRYPGKYPVTTGSTRLSDLVRWAGGLTEEASLGAAKLIRRQAAALEDREYERLREIPVADMRQDEYNYFKMKARANPGEMVVDFYAALVAGDAQADLLLERGDLVVIPKKKDFVTLLGMVGNPGNIKFRPGLEADDYIDLAGGYADNARKGKARVIRAESGQWVKLGEADDLRPGDTILVPEKPERDFWLIFRETLLVTTQLLAIYVVIDNATR